MDDSIDRSLLNVSAWLAMTVAWSAGLPFAFPVAEVARTYDWPLWTSTVILVVLGYVLGRFTLRWVREWLTPASLVNRWRLAGRWGLLCVVLYDISGYWSMLPELLGLPMWLVFSAIPVMFGSVFLLGRWPLRVKAVCGYPGCKKPVADDAGTPRYFTADEFGRKGGGVILICGGCAIMCICAASYESKWLMKTIERKWRSV